MAGPGPKLTTCLRALMMRQRRRRGKTRELTAWAAQVYCWLRPSASSQRPVGAPIGPRCRRPCANWFALRRSHPHWSCASASAQKQLLLLSSTASAPLFLISARRAGDCTSRPARQSARPRIVGGGKGLPLPTWVRASAAWIRTVSALQPQPPLSWSHWETWSKSFPNPTTSSPAPGLGSDACFRTSGY